MVTPIKTLFRRVYMSLGLLVSLFRVIFACPQDALKYNCMFILYFCAFIYFFVCLQFAVINYIIALNCVNKIIACKNFFLTFFS